MRLNKEEYDLFMTIYPPLMHQVARKKGFIPQSLKLEDYQAVPAFKRAEVRNTFYEDLRLLDEYLAEKAGTLTSEQIEILQGFRHFKEGNFFVVDLSEKNALMIDGINTYAVLALNDPFHYFWKKLPVLTHTVLLPFKGKIIYDGLAADSPITITKEMITALQFLLDEARRKKSIITQLPMNNGWN